MEKKERVADHLESKPKKIKLENQHEQCCVNQLYTSDPFQSKLRMFWRERSPFKDETTQAELFSEPFQCCCLPDFLSASPPSDSGPKANGDEKCSRAERKGNFLGDLVSELLRLKFYEKNNDLYQFHQSDDLKKFKSPCILSLRALFREKCLPWLRAVTGIELTDTIDTTCSKYEFTDTLLCHDDELEGRRIAFIFYLVPQDWSEKDGGLLDLFDTDDLGQPGKVVKSLVPTWNSFVFFDVNAKSFHQVSEVLAAGKTRLSVNGWFHGPPSPRPPPHRPFPLPLAPPLSLELDVLSDWINPTYLDVGVQSQIQEQFEADSQIELPNFLLYEKYEMLCEEMRVSEIKWTVEGPPNRKHVHVAEVSTYLPLTKAFMSLLVSKPFCLLLAHMTELELVDNTIKFNHKDITTTTQSDSSIPKLESEDKSSNGLELKSGDKSLELKSELESEDKSSNDLELKSNALCRGELCRWCPGDYTLVGDPSDPGHGRFCLEAAICFNCEEWSEDVGGITTYIAEDADEELLSVSPSPNSFSLVYRDKDLLRFRKYINHRCRLLTCGAFCTASGVYVENSADKEE